MIQHLLSKICAKCFIVLLLAAMSLVQAQAQMGIENLPLGFGAGCDPLTYNRFTGSYHSNLYIGNQVGSNVLLAWGQNMLTYTTAATGDITAPVFVSTASYAGTPYEVRSSSTGGGSGQSVMGLRTSSKLYIFGDMTNIASITSMLNFGGSSLIKPNADITSKLPAGIAITDVAQFAISPTAIAIVTNLGHVYMLTKTLNLQGDKAVAGPAIWHHVTLSNGTTFLAGVVKLSLSNSGAFALTSTGKIYYWGAPANVNGTVNTTTNYNYAYDMSVQIPTGINVVDVVTLGQSGTNPPNTLFILGNNLRVYSCGLNQFGVLGNGTTSTATNQAKFQMLSGISNIVRIDGNTEAGLFTMGAMSTTGHIYGWGNGVASMLGIASQLSFTGTYTNISPVDIFGAGGFSDFSISGHFTIAFFTNLSLPTPVDQYWYVGHNIGGSIGIPSNTTPVISSGTTAKLDAPATISFDCSNTQPTINAPSSFSPFITCAGIASASQVISILGTSLTNDILITAPAGFEISLTSGTGYVSSITLTGTGGFLPSTNIYVRASAGTAGSLSGNLVLSSDGATTQTIPISGSINPLPVIASVVGAARTGPGSLIVSGTVSPAAGTTIDWYANPTGGTALLGGNLAYTTGIISSTTTYFAEARNITTGCVSSTRTPVIATINGTLFAGSVGSNQSYCVGQKLDTLQSLVIASGGTGAISYQWQLSTDNISFTNIAGATNLYYNPIPPTVTTYYRRLANTALDGNFASNTISIVVNPKPVANF
jgi:alpha-tubulin suppressor-like RCC1 family protein